VLNLRRTVLFWTSVFIVFVGQKMNRAMKTFSESVVGPGVRAKTGPPYFTFLWHTLHRSRNVTLHMPVVCLKCDIVATILPFILSVAQLCSLLLKFCRSHWPRGLRRRSSPLGYWDRWFESRSGHGSLFLCLYVVLSCVGRGLCNKLITRPKEFYRVSK
jgi:hypothetical protein